MFLPDSCLIIRGGGNRVAAGVAYRNIAQVKSGTRPVKNSAIGSAADVRCEEACHELAGRLAGRMESGAQLVPGSSNLTLYRFDAPTAPVGYLLEPSLCLILQGRKKVVLGDDEFSYGAGEFFITSVDLPVIAQILEASPQQPYVGLVLQLDKMLINRLVMEAPLPVIRTVPAGNAIKVSSLDSRLFDAVERLVDLGGEPRLMSLLSPLIQQEILLRLLTSECGPKIRHIATGGSPTHQISRAIDWIKSHLPERLRIQDLAAHAGVSVSTLHHHFRALTSLSPLQFQKHLRLNEARRLMLNERMDAATASFEVGYESPSQFSREYSRLFGAPPLRDIKAMAADDGP